MKRVSRRIGLVAIGVSLLSLSTVEAITVKVVAVGVNGIKLPAPASSVNLSPGDFVEAEILVSGWAGELTSVSVWQVSLDNTTLMTPDPPNRCDVIKPLHFDEQLLRPAGAFFSHASNPGTNGRGVCDATSTNEGINCVNAPITCRPMCIGGLRDGQLCDMEPCTGGGICSTPTCVDGKCLDSFDSGDTGGLCATPDNQCDSASSTACAPRADFIMADGASICLVKTFEADYVYGCTTFGGAGTPDTGGEFYAGTILLEVSSAASGTFLLDVSSDPTVTFFTEPSGVDAVVSSVPLEMVFAPCGTVGACCTGLGANACEVMLPETCAALGGAYEGDNTTCGAESCGCPRVVSAEPPNCAIDARYPKDPNALPRDPRRGLDSVQVTFDSEVGGFLTANDILESTVGGGGFAQSRVDVVTNLGGGTIQIDFTRSVLAQRWFCLAFCGDNTNKVCWGRLPADVNGDGTASPADILEIIDGLNGLVQQGIWQCDVDLSGQCGAPDILGVIDLLNGAGFDKSWNGETLSVGCPTAP